MKTFPTIVLAVFVALGLFGVIIFASYTALQENAVGAVRIWGSIPTETMRPVLEKLRENNSNFDDVTYESKSSVSLVPDLVTAIAAGRGPDLVFFPAGHLLSDGDKLLTIPYSSMSRRDFQDTFVEAGEVFLFEDGIRGLPVLIDPLVMYWNRSLFSAANISEPPRYWDTVTELAPRLSSSNERGTIQRSAIALGTWENVRHAKSVLLSLLWQLGNPVVSFTGERYESALERPGSQEGFSAGSALRFYVDFADPVKSTYSWNLSQPDSRDAFIAGNLAMYIGRTSELHGIRLANPNLNFDVAPTPGIRGGGAGVSAEVTGLSIPRGSQNPAGALLVAQALVMPDVNMVLEDALHVPSVRRAPGTSTVSDPYAVVFQNAALSSFAFLDPDPGATDSLLKRMVENVSSGSLTVSEAVSSASRELTALLGVQ